MTFRVHFASGTVPAPRGPLYLYSAAQNHSQEDGRDGYVAALHGQDDLEAQLESIRRPGERIEYMDFHTHGGPGSIALGGDNIAIDMGHQRLDWMRFAQFADLFVPNAYITFIGCAVAGGWKGELFLARCAYAFLRTAGGTVSGNVGDAYGDSPMLDRHFAISFQGSIEAYVPSGGGPVNLRRERYLSTSRTRGAAQLARRRCRAYLDNYGLDGRAYQTVVSCLRSADDIIHSLIGPSHRYWDLGRAWNRLEVIYLRLHNAGWAPDRTPWA